MEQKGLLNTNTISVNYGSRSDTDTQASHIQPYPNKFSFDFGKVLQFIYIITTILIIIGFIFVIGLKTFQNAFVIATIISVAISCLYSCYALVKMGTIKSQVTEIKNSNNIYKNSIETLKKRKNVLKNEISDFEVETHQLNQHLNEVQESLNEYSQLIAQLETLAQSKENIMDVVDYTNETVERMLKLIHLNHRAYLLQQFYQIFAKDSKKIKLKHESKMDTKACKSVVRPVIMNEQKYKRFLFRISIQWRQKFEFLGSNLKEIWSRQEINVEQFLWKVDEIVGIAHDLKILEFNRAYTEVSVQLSVEMEQDYEEEKFIPDPLVSNVKFEVIKRLNVKSIQLSAKFENLPFEQAIDISFVDLIDDNHNSEIWGSMEKFRLKTRSLKRVRSVHLSQDDISVGTLRRELNVQPRNVGIFGNIGFLK
eukprot:282031_1